ncbi:hypothetical protein AB0P21_16065 [Kribbella sp. NPDC056861]|uniref:hypothetical protein n=1 Tax=Kribbella sp. NPDC056861 TaxID=3154857 RepID=UPI00342A1084
MLSSHHPTGARPGRSSTSPTEFLLNYRTRTSESEDPIITPSTFDQLFESAAPLIANGTHQRDTPPVEGGRWPVSVVLRPPADSALSQTLDHLTAEAAALAGPGHWQTGQTSSAHLTVRALEYYRPVVDPDEPVIKRYQAAIERAAATAGPARIAVTGLTLTPGTVMASAEALDDQAPRLMSQLADELGDDGWHERDYGRDIWYFNLLHFTTDLPDPTQLIDWIRAHRTTDFGQVTIDTVELVRFHHSPDGPRPFMRPEVLGAAYLRNC